MSSDFTVKVSKTNDYAAHSLGDVGIFRTSLIRRAILHLRALDLCALSVILMFYLPKEHLFWALIVGASGVLLFLQRIRSSAVSAKVYLLCPHCRSRVVVLHESLTFPAIKRCPLCKCKIYLARV